MNEKLLTHLKTYTYSIIILGDIADNAKCRITAESCQCLNQGKEFLGFKKKADTIGCLLYTSPSPRDKRQSRMPSSA